MSLICPKCNTANTDEARFCKNCGADISEELKKRYEEKEENVKYNNIERRKVEAKENFDFVLGLALVIILVIGFIMFNIYNKNSNKLKASAPVSVEQNQTNNKIVNQNVSFKSEINDLILNVMNFKGKAELMKLSFEIRSTEPTIDTLVKSSRANIIDVVISQISYRNSEELLTNAGRDLLREDLVSAINSILNKATSNQNAKKNIVSNISFTTFVIKFDTDKNEIVQNDVRNPKAEAMAQQFVQDVKKVEATIGANPNMSIKTYSIDHRIYQDRTEYNYKAKEIQPNIIAYKQQLETEYCPALKNMKDTYDVEFIYNIYGNDSKKVFTHTLNCR